jgi:hypothetical protein
MIKNDRLGRNMAKTEQITQRGFISLYKENINKHTLKAKFIKRIMNRLGLNIALLLLIGFSIGLIVGLIL